MQIFSITGQGGEPGGYGGYRARPCQPLRLLLSALGALAFLTGLAAPVAAQNLFAPVARVNDQVITGYELSQRTTFLTLLRAPGNVRDLAMQQLVEERLKEEVARQMGITVSAETVREGMAEFAGRADLSTEQFLQAIGQGGVAAETFRDFVANGMLWREVVRARFAGRISVSDSEIDRAMATAKPERGLRVLLSELLLPADNADNKRASQARARELRKIGSVAEFAAAARVYSIAPTRNEGGELDWRNIADLPPALRGQLARMSPGQITAPIETGGSIALYMLRDKQQLPNLARGDVITEYARLLLPGGRSAANLALAARIGAEADNCTDFYGFAAGRPEEALIVDSRPISQVPTEIALELSKLDPGEISTALRAGDGDALVVLMLCGRTALPKESLSRDALRISLSNQRLVSMADAFLQELKANASIEYIRR